MFQRITTPHLGFTINNLVKSVEFTISIRTFDLIRHIMI